MKRNKFLILPVLVLFLTAVSCGKETAVGGGNLDNNPEEASGEGGIPSPVEPDTFAAVSDVISDPAAPEAASDGEGSKAHPHWESGVSQARAYWELGDQVKVYYDRAGSHSGVYEVTTINADDKRVATLGYLSGERDSEYGTGTYYAVYPASGVTDFSSQTFTISIPAEQSNTDASMDGADPAGQIMMAKCGPEKVLSFKQVVSLIRYGKLTTLLTGFTCTKVVMTSADHYLAGDLEVTFSGSKPTIVGIKDNENASHSVTLNIPRGKFNSNNFTYVFAAPGTFEAGDLTFEFTITNGTYTYTIVKTSPADLTLYRGKYAQIAFAMPEFTDLGSKAYTGLASNQTANCYVVNTPGYYCFDAATRGNGVVTNGATAASVGATITGAASVSAYHSDGTDFVDGDFTSGGFLYANGKVYFKTTASLSAAGNKLVSVKDGSGNTLWSWHIWCNDDLADIKFKSKEDSQYYTFMNMNLGAHQVAFVDAGCNGYYYQWGRKDPFQQNKNTLTTPFVDAWNTQGSLANSILHPETMYGLKSELEAAGTTFYTDWWCAGLTSANLVLYGENTINGYTPVATFSKTMFDPCPPGYHVPTLAALYGFRANTFTSADGVTTIKDADNTTITIPLVYLRQPNVASDKWGNTSCYTWSCYPGAVNGSPSTPDRSAPRFWITTGGSGYNNQSIDRRSACAIRCQKD